MNTGYSTTVVKLLDKYCVNFTIIISYNYCDFKKYNLETHYMIIGKVSFSVIVSNIDNKKKKMGHLH